MNPRYLVYCFVLNESPIETKITHCAQVTFVLLDIAVLLSADHFHALKAVIYLMPVDRNSVLFIYFFL